MKSRKSGGGTGPYKKVSAGAPGRSKVIPLSSKGGAKGPRPSAFVHPPSVPPVPLPHNYYQDFLRDHIEGKAPAGLANILHGNARAWPDVDLATPQGQISNEISKKFIENYVHGIDNVHTVPGMGPGYQPNMYGANTQPAGTTTFMDLNNVINPPVGIITHEATHGIDHQGGGNNAEGWNHLRALHNTIGGNARARDANFSTALDRIHGVIDPEFRRSYQVPQQLINTVDQVNAFRNRAGLGNTADTTWSNLLNNGVAGGLSPDLNNVLIDRTNVPSTNPVHGGINRPIDNNSFSANYPSETRAFLLENASRHFNSGEQRVGGLPTNTGSPTYLPANSRQYLRSHWQDIQRDYPAVNFPTINHYATEREASLGRKNGGHIKLKHKKYASGGYVMNNNPYNNSPYNQFGSAQFAQAQFQNTDFDPYTTDNFAQNDKQPYIEGVNQGQMGNPMLGQVSEGSLYPVQSSTDTPYLNNNTGYSSYAGGGHVNDLANNARSRLNVLALSQLMRNDGSNNNVQGFASYASGGHVDSPEFEEQEFDEMPIFDNEIEESEFRESEEYTPYHSLAEIIRQQGEGEDTILAHINPIEAAVLKSMGGSGTINPKTGLPQFGLFSNPKKWFKSVVGPAAGVVLGNMILPGLGGIIGGALGGATGSAVRGRKDYMQSALRGAAMGTIAPTAASLLGSGASSMGATGAGNYLTNYGNTNAILPSLGMGNSVGAPAGESASSTVGREAGKKAVEQSFADKLMVNSKDFFTQPSNIMSTAVLANQLIPQKEKKVKETTPEEIAANEKRYRNASRLSQAELEAEAAYSLAQREAKRRARNNLYGLESSSVTPLYRKVNSPAEYENTRRWLEYYDNPEFTGNQVRMKEGGTYHPRFGYEIEEMQYPMGIIGYLNGYSGGQDDDINAKLSDGEYVIDASTVSDLGDGNNANGAKKLDQMRRNIREHKRGGSINMPPKAKSLLSYMRG